MAWPERTSFKSGLCLASSGQDPDQDPGAQGFSYCEPSLLAELEAQSRLDTLLPSLGAGAGGGAATASPETLRRLGLGAAVGGG